MITQTISTLPVVVGRYDADFIDTADKFLNTLPGWANELNTFITQFNTDLEWINTAATNAFAAANFKGVWDSSIEYKAGGSVTYNGLPYFAIEDNTNEQPDASDKWIQILTTNGGQVYGDLEFTQDVLGVILIDRDDNTKKYRLFIQGGNLGIEEV
jgi:hypothetical protein